MSNGNGTIIIKETETVVIESPMGLPGIQGPAGPTGSQGTPGLPNVLLQVVDTIANLPTTGSAEQSVVVEETNTKWTYDDQNPTAPSLIWRNTGALFRGGTGPEGPVGPTGPQGNEGPTGTQGPEGATGPAGPQGVAGPQGPQGPAIVILGVKSLIADLPATGNPGEAWIVDETDTLWVYAPQSPTPPSTVWRDTGGLARGPQGPAGPTGAQGPQGVEGPAGPRGLTGNTGPTGPQGLRGEKGSTGAQGPIGLTGAPGADGAAGPTGPQGLQGIPGAPGAQGPQGNPGAKGDKGDTGDEGPTGPAGPAGATGATGSAGPTGPAGPKGDKGDKGDTGPAGATGAQGPEGAAVNIQGTVALIADLPSTGSAGDAWIVEETNTLWVYAPTAPTAPSTLWRNTGGLGRGPEGPQGPQGIQGEKGDKGDAGAAGAPGAQGATGPAGPQGIQGPAGTTDHTLLTNRGAADQHPIASITDLVTTLAGKLNLTGGTMSGLLTISRTFQALIRLVRTSGGDSFGAEVQVHTDEGRPFQLVPLDDAGDLIATDALTYDRANSAWYVGNAPLGSAAGDRLLLQSIADGQYYSQNGGTITGQVVMAPPGPGSGHPQLLITAPGNNWGAVRCNSVDLPTTYAEFLIHTQSRRGAIFVNDDQDLAQFYFTAGGHLVLPENASDDTHALRRQAGDARYLQLIGGTLTGDLDLDGNNLVDVNSIRLEQNNTSKVELRRGSAGNLAGANLEATGDDSNIFSIVPIATDEARITAHALSFDRASNRWYQGNDASSPDAGLRILRQTDGDNRYIRGGNGGIQARWNSYEAVALSRTVSEGDRLTILEGNQGTRGQHYQTGTLHLHCSTATLDLTLVASWTIAENVADITVTHSQQSSILFNNIAVTWHSNRWKITVRAGMDATLTRLDIQWQTPFDMDEYNARDFTSAGTGIVDNFAQYDLNWFEIYENVNFWGLYSPVRRLTRRARRAVLLRRADDATREFGFGDDHLVDQDEIITWANGQTLRIAAIYDQSGNDHDFIQNTADNQLEFVPRALNNRFPGIRGDNTLRLLRTAQDFPGGDTPYTYQVIFSTTLAQQHGLLASGQYGTLNLVNAFRTKSVGGIGYSNYWWGNDLEPNHAYNDGLPQVTTAYWHPHLGRAIRANNTQVGSDNPSRDAKRTVATPLSLGVASDRAGTTNWNVFYSGDFYEVSVEADVTKFQAYEIERVNFFRI